jgi:hypothetical protein
VNQHGEIFVCLRVFETGERLHASAASPSSRADFARRAARYRNRCPSRLPARCEHRL